MKKLILSTLLSTLFVLFSCSEDSTSEPENTSAGTMSATVNGNSWNSIPGAAIANVTEVDFDGESQTALQIIGTAPNFSSFTISLPISELSVGSQTFTGDSANGILGYFNGSSNFYTSQHVSGQFTINITTLNLVEGKMSGTFSGKLYDDTDALLNITNGAFSNISIFSTEYYSNGSMSLKRNSGQIFTMDTTNSDGKFITIAQSSANNSISIFGNNTTLTSDFGIYNINFPKDVSTGTYTLTDNGTYSAGLGNSDTEPEYTITGGSLTITSHSGNNVVGTFNYTANNGVQTVTISNGNFSITHK
ncbi:hypothetical protein [Flavobacterium terrigena]|uniref:Uncharacterized protein n=1 Tax=Flavobacterium terrigena TaxID=402734 RepID=A0A1H6QUI1_9FLAO|nr:hypothetical protein [Flavobacterium terrigena]SEI47351.1 hypothetical protein SAMN05660918_0802 [Flavobacterium terrigena]